MPSILNVPPQTVMKVPHVACVANVGTKQSKALIPALSSLKELLKNEVLHAAFVDGAADGAEQKYDAAPAAPGVSRNLSVLTGLLVSQSQNTQVLYEIGFSLWLLSFNVRRNAQSNGFLYGMFG
jgi:hypothetical protein